MWGVCVCEGRTTVIVHVIQVVFSTYSILKMGLTGNETKRRLGKQHLRIHEHSKTQKLFNYKPIEFSSIYLVLPQAPISSEMPQAGAVLTAPIPV